jgi:hypothetical protein
MTEKKTSRIDIPTSLYMSIQERIKETGFDSVDQYVTYVLREIMADDVAEDVSISRDDEERIRERLRSLGYLD